MPWSPERAYFAIVALVDPVRPLVLIVGDDFAEVTERGRTLWRLKPGVPLQIVWGIDGRPVSPQEQVQLGAARAWSAGSRAADGTPLLGPVHQAPPVHPRLVRTDIGGKLLVERNRRPPIEEISPANSAVEQIAQAATFWLRRERRACDNLGADAPKTPET